MTTLDYLEKIDETLAHWEDYFHGQEGADVTEARFNLNKIRQQLLIHGVVESAMTDDDKIHYDCLKDCCNNLLDAVDSGKVPQKQIMGLRILLPK